TPLALREELLQARNAAKLPTAMQQRVVVVDDDASIHRWYDRVLDEALPLSEVVCFEDARAALADIQADPPDLVLTDLLMPGLDGFELTRAIKSVAATREVPVIICTGEGGAPDWRR